ncbi:recombinase family protein [Peptostreptococcus porci]|uniref:recombinase family protein n=1 Tax=Peptostreptococcus porci TaxID=2652282 RepID=UPI0023F438B4|nr:recombinase family protein [Peptostreptococcus porci]MDD7183058.1 recombinase family protein [Peptostreptococcus porci]MDY5963523.1 recombinase family protein [Peptostreptococcus porci]
MRYGYIRVSTKEQNIDRQLSAILKEGIEMNNIFIDKASGKDFKRKSYNKLIKNLKENDDLYIKSIDRLGRNYDEIIKEWNQITKKTGANIIVIDFPLLDTREKKDKDITGKFLSDIVLQILSYVAQVERENIRQRQKEGIIEAQKRGVKFGRPKRKKPENYTQIYNLWETGEISLRQAAKELNVSPSMFSKWIKKD